MPFSQTAEYALRAVIWMGSHSATPLTTSQIAAATHVPAGYLSKVMQSLGRAGLVRAQRGLGGGFTLLYRPEDLTVLDVINAVDPVRRITSCPLGLEVHGKVLCPLHRKLDDALAMIEEAFAAATIAELLGSRARNTPLCRMTVRGKGTAKSRARRIGT